MGNFGSCLKDFNSQELEPTYYFWNWNHVMCFCSLNWYGDHFHAHMMSSDNTFNEKFLQDQLENTILILYHIDSVKTPLVSVKIQ